MRSLSRLPPLWLLALLPWLPAGLAAPTQEAKKEKSEKQEGKKKQEKKQDGKNGAPPAEKADEGEGQRSLAQIEKEMAQAAGAKNYARLGALADEALRGKEPAAYKAVIGLCLRGEDRELEIKVFQILKEVDDPTIRAIVYQEAVRNPNFKTRIILLGVANNQRADPGAFAVVVLGLRDSARPVVLTAVRYLRECQEPQRAVPPLIEALSAYERNRGGRIYHDLVNALKKLTGGNLQASVDWRNFWEAKKQGLASGAPRGVTKVKPATFFSVSIESDRILFMIDVSGSMEKRDPPIVKKKPDPPPDGKTVVRKTKTVTKKGDDDGDDAPELPVERQRIYRVKQELIRSIGELPNGVSFSVLNFSSHVTFLDEPPRLIVATDDNKKRAVEWVKALKASGETWTDTAFERALGELKDVDTIFLLSDGQPYRKGHQIPGDQVLEEIKTLNRFTKCRIHTIGFLQAGDNLQRFLWDLAEQHDGIYKALE